MDAQNSKAYLKQLQDIVEGYNSSIHNPTKFSPFKAWNNKKIHVRIRDNLQNYYSKIKKEQPRFKIGDTVTIRVLNTKFSRGFNPQTTNEPFVVLDVSQHLPIPMYTLKSLSKENDVIKGKFYAHELIRIVYP